METAAETSPPAYSAVPSGLSFTCKGRLPGYYADVQTRCQASKHSGTSTNVNCLLSGLALVCGSW